MNEQIDASIPVLTEIIHAPNETPLETSKASTATPTASQRLSMPAASSKPAATGSLNFAPQALIQEAPLTTPSVPSFSHLTPAPEEGSDEWNTLEQTVRENVLKQVLTRIDFVLEHRVSDSLADVLQKAVDQLADDIRAGLKQSIEEVVTRAVNQELAKLKHTR